MIVLDTNIVSELLTQVPSKAVRYWLEAVPTEDRFTTSLTLAELRCGTERLPEGRRKDELTRRSAELIDAFGGQLLAFDEDAATQYAPVVLAREAAGQPIEAFDAQIAAICRAHGASLATRNVKDFDGLGIDVVDPWASGG